MTEQILHALKYCHSQDIIHRDLRCGTILLNKEGDVKIQDFGYFLYYKNSFSTQKISPDSFIGNPIYMSPEQLKNEPYSTKIDIWALGISLIEMAELNPPYNNHTQLRIFDKLKNNPQI